MKSLNGRYVTDDVYFKAVLCQNASRIAGNVINPSCWSNKRERKVVVTYREGISDTLYLCEDCTKVVKREAKKHGYKVRTSKL